MSYGLASLAAALADGRRSVECCELEQESVRARARRYGINGTAEQKWRKRTSMADQPMDPDEPHSTTLSLEQEAMIVAVYRRHTPPPDDCLYALQP